MSSIKFVFLVIFLIVICCGGSYLYLDIRNHPPEPLYQGDFPSQPVWIYEARQRITSTPLIHGKIMFIRTQDFVCAIDIASNKEIWCSLSFGDRRLNLPPQLSDDMLVVPEMDSSISVFSANSGIRKWSSISNLEDTHQENSPIYSFIVKNNSVFVARRSYKLTSYDLYTGEKQWESWVPDRSKLYLAADSQYSYLAAENKIIAYDIEQGIQVWERDLKGIVGPILLSDGILYYFLPYETDRIVALDLDTQEEVWRVISSEIKESYFPFLVSYGDFLYLSGQRLAIISRSDGKIRCTVDETYNLERPIVLGNQVYVRDTEKTLYAFDKMDCRDTGRMHVQYNTSLDYDPERGPAVAGDLLVVPFGDNRIFAYRP